MMKRWLGLAAVVALVACGGDEGKDSAETGETHDHSGHGGGTGLDYGAEAMTDGGSFMVSYASSVDPIPLSEPFDLTVMVMDHMSGDMVMDADLAFTAAMPDHGHGMNTEPQVTANGDGTFSVVGMLFHMEGWWTMTADVTVGGVTETAEFNVDCCQ